MSRATPSMRDFAQRLIAYEMRVRKSSQSRTRPAFPVIEKLGPHLATLVGSAGYHALLSRALALAGAEFRWLQALRVQTDGTLEVPEGLEARVEHRAMLDGGVVLLAHLLGLLVDFIGENLTLRLVGEVWPKVALDHLNFDRGGKK